MPACNFSSLKPKNFPKISICFSLWRSKLSGFPAYLYLENGELYSGIGFGIKKHETAEVVFNTALSGYQEIITDPSYAKQIITFTNPHIGNTGINEEDNEASFIYASGIVIRSLTEIPSSWRSTTSLQDFLIKIIQLELVVLILESL